MKRKLIQKSVKRGSSVVISFITLIATVGCRSTSGTETPLEGYELWSVPATEKVLRDVPLADELKSSAKVEIDTATNEYESAQLIISAKGDVKEYDVELSDLIMEGGDTVYEKTNISIYNMKYTNVVSPWTPSASAGWYPDAILPFDSAVEAGENTVSSGENQSIWFSFNTPATQAVGTYKGSVKVTVDGEENVVPVTVRVRNVAVSETTHSMSMFINKWMYFIAEYGDTQELVDAYTKMMYEYRIAPTSLIIDTANTNEYYKAYADKAYEMAGHEGASTIALPCSKGTDGIPYEMLTKYIRELAKKSLETGVNLVKKARVYGIDEPISNNALDRTKAFYESFVENIQNIVAELTKDKQKYIEEYEVAEEYYDEILDSASEVCFVTTTMYREDYAPYIDVWCPHFNSFESGYALGYYPDEDETWFYGAVSPKAPYPTYHLDDTLLSSRMTGWLRSVYNVEGEIYWGVNVYGDYDGSYQYFDDYYENPAHYKSVNGDGFLFYPGKKYGIEGPIPSIRLESIRDSYEEYELLYAINEKYAEIGAHAGMEFSATNMIADIASPLYSGMKVLATNESFATARRSLLDLSEFTESGICFIDYNDNGEGLIEYKLYVPDSATLTVTGATKGTETAVTGGKIISYTADLRSETVASAVRFETKIGDETVAVERRLSGKVTLFGASELTSSLSGSIVADGCVIVDGEAMTGVASQLLRISMPSVDELTKQEVRFTNTGIFAQLNANTNKAIYNMYYDGENSLFVEMKVKYKKQRYKQSVIATTFEQGWNFVEWSGLSTINWEKNGEVEYIEFAFGDAGDEARADIYIKNVVIYAERGE